MRFVVGVLACIGVGATSLALADPSSAPSAPPAPSAPSAPIAPSAPTAAAATAAPATPAYDPAVERHLRAAGYKPEMHNGEKIWCRAEPSLGSRLAVQKNCGTAEQLKLSEQQTKEMLEKAQRQQKSGPSGN